MHYPVVLHVGGSAFLARVRGLVTLSLLSCAGVFAAADQNQRLWYDRPATYWNSECLHVGNGYMGASFYGGVDREVLELSEKSLWTGGPANGDWAAGGVNPKAREALPEIRRAVTEGRIKEADKLTEERFLGDYRNFGNFTALGSLVLEFGGDHVTPSDYRRSLDLADSLGRVSYTVNGVGYSREYFCSYPDRVLAVKIRADQKGALNTSVAVAIKQAGFKTTAAGDSLEVRGRIDGNGRPFHVRIKATHTGGSLQAEGAKLVLKGGDELVLLVSIATNYRLHYPDYIGEEPEITTGAIIARASTLGYDKLRARHIQDYRGLYDRVAFTVEGNLPAEQRPTDLRLKDYNAGQGDPGLKVLLFNLGRYLIISSSRPGTLPANLQGVWNVFAVAPWAGNYQSNINLQEIYWSCGPTGLLECQQAYVDWVRDLTLPGREVAQRCYGTAGWVSHTTGNIWGWASPAGGLPWAVYPMGSAWHCQHVWEQFAFSQDEAYLRDVAYPILKGAALFYTQNLTTYQGHLIFAPSMSAEHGANPGAEGLLASSSSDAELYSMAGPIQDAEMLWDLFTNTIEAASILKLDSDFCRLLAEKRAGLLPLMIGKHGQLQEWAEDIDNPACHHRHIAHLYAVCPGRQIDPIKDVRLAAAAKKALDLRGDERRLADDAASGGNWSLAHRMWAWGRLLEGERANAIFTRLMKEAMFENLLTYQQANFNFGRDDLYEEPGGLFCHYQLDASASLPGFMSEMLLQSHLGELSLLPALPAEFRTGSILGLRARGGFIVDLAWKNGELTKAVIHAPSGRALPPIRVKNALIDAKTSPAIEIRPLS